MRRIVNDHVEAVFATLLSRVDKLGLTSSFVNDGKVTQKSNRNLAVNLTRIDGVAEHPFGVKEGGGGVLIVGVPTSKLACAVMRKRMTFLQEPSYLVTF